MDKVHWKSFQSHLSTTLKKLYTENVYADATHVSDDQVQIKAHKFVLSACSPTLAKLLLSNPHTHPLLYLRGVNHQELQAVLRFMYLVEAIINQDRITSFLEIVRDLQMEEFLENKTDEQSIKTDPAEHCDIYNDDDTKDLGVVDTIDEDQRLPDEDNKQDISNNQLYSCDSCEAVLNSEYNLKRHQGYKHTGVSYFCNQCDYQAPAQRFVRRHQQSRHEDVRYACNQCEYEARSQNWLKKHKQAKHEGVRYFCNQCEYQATLQRNLRQHKEEKHEGVKYSCNQCEYHATRKHRLQAHVQTKHV